MSFFRTMTAAAFVATASVGTAQADQLQDIIAEGEITVGIALTGEPIGFRDDQNNPVGYDVDFATRLAEALGVELNIVEVTGANRIPMLESGQIDLIIANITATLERAKSIDFSIPYLRTGIKLLVADGSDITSIEDLNGRSVVVGRGTTGEQMVQRLAPDAEIVYVDVFAPDGLLLLQQGRAEAAIEDSSLVDYAATQFPELESVGELLTSDPIAIGVRKGEPNMLRWLDMYVSQYISSGAYDENYTKWWGTEGPDLVAPW
jgi:ABC-type amino acid transport substrate-binding protein